jgi:hypothetical protein
MDHHNLHYAQAHRQAEANTLDSAHIDFVGQDPRENRKDKIHNNIPNWVFLYVSPRTAL